jgi:hypothetical protein
MDKQPIKITRSDAQAWLWQQPINDQIMYKGLFRAAGVRGDFWAWLALTCAAEITISKERTNG